LAFSWAQYRPDGGKFVPENLDASLCTHIIYAFAVLKDSKLVPFEWNDEDTDWSKGLLNSIISLVFFSSKFFFINPGMYSRVIQLKKTNNNLKVSLAVGGWNFGSGPFSDMVADEKLRSQFVQQATQFIRDHQFDGLDLDWVSIINK
jgi:chitinase